jgi:uncharacterized protein (TIGR04255 family)
MFDFPHVERKTFSRNFLRTIIFQVSYDEMTDLTEKKSAITTIFKDKFPRVDDKITNGIQIVISNDKTPITRNIQDSKTGMSLEFKSSDGQKVLSIERSQLTYTSSNKGYTNFESLVEDLSGITEFFSLCGIDNVKKVAIRKINSIDFKVGGNPTDTLAQLISPDLLTNLYYIPNSNYIKQNIQTINYQLENHRLNVKYGLNIPPVPNSEIAQVIIDIDLFSTDKIESNYVFMRATEINNEIFDIFNWTISDNTKKILDGQN